MRRVVVFPAPLGPRKPVTDAGSTVKPRSETAWTLPKALLRPRTSIRTGSRVVALPIGCNSLARAAPAGSHPSARGGVGWSGRGRPRRNDLGRPGCNRSHRVPAVSETANAYRTVVVGTDGSESSLRAVARAGALAGACGATLVIACAYLPTEADARELSRAQDVLGDEAYQVVGSHPAEDTVRTAAERARSAGAKDVKTLAVQGSPVEALLDVVRREDADLLVIGNRGLAGIKGRLAGLGPARRAPP